MTDGEGSLAVGLADRVATVTATAGAPVLCRLLCSLGAQLQSRRRRYRRTRGAPRRWISYFICTPQTLRAHHSLPISSESKLPAACGRSSQAPACSAAMHSCCQR